MKVFLATVFILGCVVSFTLCYWFKYPFRFGFYHILSVSLLLAFIAVIILAIKYLVKDTRWAFVISNVIAYSTWIFFCFFYPVVLGSNHFWGNTITFEILQNYLTSFDSILSILPVEKWLLVLALILYFVMVSALYYPIRIKRKFFSREGEITTFPRKKIGLAGLLLIAVIALLGKPLMRLKRTMHFNQEPLLYFAFGPMWDTHSDQLLTSEHKNSQKDIDCINNIKPPAEKDKLAIIILLDALRSDHLPMYGYGRNTTPFLDSLYRANKLIKIKNSFSTSTNTIGGISALFYSKDWDDFNYSQLNMMQYFQRAGYTTTAFLTGYHSGWYGLSAMYRNYCDNFYESTSAYHTAIDDDLVTLKKIQETPFQAGSFIFIHLLSTHSIGKRNAQFRTYRPDKIGINTDVKNALINNYDNGILQGDFVIRRIFEKLSNEKLLDRTTLFIVGDHGDLIGDEGVYGHSSGIHEKLLEVPILIYDQDMAWYRENRLASLIDIGPTLTQKIFGDTPACWQGRSLHNPRDSVFRTKVSAATIKTDLLNGSLSLVNDTIRLDIFNKEGELQKTAFKTDSVNWKTIFSRK